MAVQARAGAQTKRLTLDDVDLEYYEAGSGPPLISLHGMLELPRWQDYHQALAQRFRVIAPSHPGFGSSSRPNWMEGIDDLAYFYLDLIDHLKLDQVRLLGHSFGAWLAAEVAIRDPGSIAKLVLVDAVGIRPSDDPVGPPGGWIADWLVLEPEALRAKAWHDSSTGDRLKLPAEEATSEAELMEIMANRRAATVFGWRPFFYNPRLRQWLHRIKAPTLVVWGEHDGVVPRAVGQAYADGIPGARLVTMPGSAHLPHLEQPEEFARLAGDFLA